MENRGAKTPFGAFPGPLIGNNYNRGRGGPGMTRGFDRGFHRGRSMMRFGSRGRAVPVMNFEGQFGYTSNIDKNGNDVSSAHHHSKLYRGRARGRSSCNSGVTRSSSAIHTSMVQRSAVPHFNKETPVPKRGRYEQESHTSKFMSYSQHHVPSHPIQYNNYQNQSQTQTQYNQFYEQPPNDQYMQSIYRIPPPSIIGVPIRYTSSAYSQVSYGHGQDYSSHYPQEGAGYLQSYTGYNSHQYGDAKYSSQAPPDYSQQGAQYDIRSYGNDASAYSQDCAKTDACHAGYY